MAKLVKTVKKNRKDKNRIMDKLYKILENQSSSRNNPMNLKLKIKDSKK